jgi:hypothetical protein
MSASLTGCSAPQLIVKDRKGVQIGAISGLPRIIDEKWDESGENLLLITDPPSDKSTGILYAYSTKDRRLQRITYGVQGNWTVGRRYVLISLSNPLVTSVSKDLGVGGWGRVLVLDSMNRFSAAMKIGGLIGTMEFSPGGGKIAYMEIEKDEFGDLEKYSIKVTDISTRKTRTLASGRMKPEFIWNGENRLVVTTYDSHAVPTLSLIGLDGSKTKLVTAKGYYRLTPIDYPTAHGRIVYESFTYGQAYIGDGDLWSVRPGEKPVRIYGHVNGKKGVKH